MEETEACSPQKRFEQLYRAAVGQRTGSMVLWRVLDEMGFFTSPASAKHHLNQPGGLVIHSLNVADAALDLCDGMPQFSRCDKNAVLVAALLHDVCKAGKYIEKPGGGYRYEDNRMLGHGEESVFIIQEWMRLREKEVLAIRWHMGAYSGERDWNLLGAVYDCCPEALCVHMADMIATHVVEVKN